MSLPFFQNGTTQDNNYFNDGPTPPPANIDPEATRSGINTIKIDGYRQGVEITQLRHYDAGFLKIHAGEPGHIIRKNRFGMDKNPIISNNWYKDLDKFNAVNFIQAQQDNSYLFGNVLTFPIVVDNNDRIEGNIHDGIIEPLTIRPIAGFYSIDAPYDAHDIRSDIMAGTVRFNQGACQILQVDYFEPSPDTVGFLDQVNKYETFFNINTTKVQPYDDFLSTPQITPYLLGNWSADMAAAVLPMTGSTDNYISTKQRSSSAGWDYDNNVSIGTDSIAFGGLTY